MSFEKIAAHYPRSVTLASGARIELRLLTAADRDAVLAFTRGLPEEDLLFLRVDLTEPAVVDEWIARGAAGQSITLVAFDGANLAGYATVHRETAPWTRRVGEIRVNVGPQYRGAGLGRVLTSNIFDAAQSLGLRKLVAHMTVDQHGAQAAFRRLGFVPEALLADYVEDRNGRPRDLVIMSHDVDGLNEFVAAPLRAV
jgi:RimJ/RimL family protein N-acetyltransferase